MARSGPINRGGQARAARKGVELRTLRGVITTEVDQSRALGVADRPPVGHVDWRLEVEVDAPQETIDELKERADARPGVYCLRTRSTSR